MYQSVSHYDIPRGRKSMKKLQNVFEKLEIVASITSAGIGRCFQPETFQRHSPRSVARALPFHPRFHGCRIGKAAARADSDCLDSSSQIARSSREFWKGAVTRRKEIKVHESNVESPIPMAPEVVLADAEPADLGGAFDACAAALPFVPAGCLRP